MGLVGLISFHTLGSSKNKGRWLSQLKYSGEANNISTLSHPNTPKLFNNGHSNIFTPGQKLLSLGRKLRFSQVNLGNTNLLWASTSSSSSSTMLILPLDLVSPIISSTEAHPSTFKYSNLSSLLRIIILAGKICTSLPHFVTSKAFNLLKELKASWWCHIFLMLSIISMLNTSKQGSPT